jgi:hypothetical protein
MYANAVIAVQHPAIESASPGEAMDERTEADALHDAADVDPHADPCCACGNIHGSGITMSQ